MKSPVVSWYFKLFLVKQILTTSQSIILDDSGTPCEGKFFQPQVWEPAKARLDVISFLCQSRDDAPHLEMRPDILVAVNFTALNISADSRINRVVNSVQVLVGLINDTAKVVKNTTPTTLLPGVNLVGILDVFRIRQTYAQPGVSAFGLFEVCYFGTTNFFFLRKEFLVRRHILDQSHGSRLARSPGIHSSPRTRYSHHSHYLPLRLF